MHSQRRPIASLALVALASLALHAPARAHDAPLTRAEVAAQYEEALRTGDLPAPGDSGMRLNERYPGRYPSKAVGAMPPLSRAQVIDDLRAARRSGDVLVSGDSGMKLNELYPDRYSTSTATVGARTRDQVRAETREAIRTGDMLAAGDSGLKLNELFPQRYAKARGTDARQMAEARPVSMDNLPQ